MRLPRTVTPLVLSNNESVDITEDDDVIPLGNITEDVKPSTSNSIENKTPKKVNFETVGMSSLLN